jgi:hypothetical protein
MIAHDLFCRVDAYISPCYSLPDGSWFYNASLMEPMIDQDPCSKDPEATPTFHAYSASGDVTAEVVYANYGRTEDFQYLKGQGIVINGSIILARYGKIYRYATTKHLWLSVD